MKLIHKRSRYDGTKFEVGLNLYYGHSFVKARQKEDGTFDHDAEPEYGPLYLAEICLVIPFWIRLFPSIEYHVPGCGYGEIYSTNPTIELTKGRQIYCLRVGATKSFAWGNSWYDMRVTCERIRLPFGKQEIVIAKNEVMEGW